MAKRCRLKPNLFLAVCEQCVEKCQHTGTQPKVNIESQGLELPAHQTIDRLTCPPADRSDNGKDASE